MWSITQAISLMALVHPSDHTPEGIYSAVTEIADQLRKYAEGDPTINKELDALLDESGSSDDDAP